MLKFIGAVALVGTLAFGAAYFGGYIDGNAEVNVTPKGRQAARDGLGGVQSGINTGLDKAKEAVAPSRP